MKNASPLSFRKERGFTLTGFTGANSHAGDDLTCVEEITPFLFLFEFMCSDEYAKVSEPSAWNRFVAHWMGECESVGGDAAGFAQGGSLDAPEPPAYEVYRRAASVLLTPGYPGSLPPIASFYRDAGSPSASNGQAQYLDTHARALLDAFERLSVTIDDGRRAAPDHLSLLIECGLLLARYAEPTAVEVFAREHLGWLGEYRTRLALREADEKDPEIKQGIRFYRFCVDLFIKALPNLFKRGEKHGKS